MDNNWKRGTRSTTPDERGSALPLVAFLFVISFGITAILALVASSLTEASRAQTAADAAALAGAVKGPIAARSAAAANGASIDRFKDNTQLGDVIQAATGSTPSDVGDVTVTVRIGKHTKTARAQKSSSSVVDRIVTEAS